MSALNPLNNQTIRIELMRDECPVIARFGANPGELKKQIAKLNRILKLDSCLGILDNSPIEIHVIGMSFRLFGDLAPPMGSRSTNCPTSTSPA